MVRALSYAKQSLRGIWFRATVFTIAGILLAIAAPALGNLIPANLLEALGNDAAATLLQILATSMLAVTTFSLTTMVSAYSTATQIGTPRSIQLLIADRTSHTALSTFVGAFAFSIVGIIALSLDVYSSSEKALLLLGTILVIAVVLVTLLRWISFLTTFGRMADIIDRVGDAASQSMSDYAEQPLLGGRLWVDPPTTAIPLECDHPGFVVKVDVAALQRIAEQENCQLWVERRPGSRIFAGHPIAYLSGKVSEESQEAIQRAFVIAKHRTFEQDPRLGLLALSEISSKSLSPGINDPGTAIEVLEATHRVLDIAMRARIPDSPDAGRVRLRLLEPQDMLQDAFRATSRDGASDVEVMMRIQKELGALIVRSDAPWTAALKAQAKDSFDRAERALELEEDRREVEGLHFQALSATGISKDSAPA